MRYATRTYEEGIKVRLPDASDQIRLAPVRALRAVFSGVGQLLLAADRLREEDARQDHESSDDQQDTLTSWDGRLSSSVRLIPPAATRALSPRGAGGGQPKRAGNDAKPATRGGKNGAGAKRATGTRAGNAGSGRKAGRSRNAAEPPRFRSLDLTGNVRMLTDQDVADQPAELPISGYDELSLPSLRARLRHLGAAELRDLLEYERSHGNREDIVTMFERRIAKLAEAAD